MRGMNFLTILCSSHTARSEMPSVFSFGIPGRSGIGERNHDRVRTTKYVGNIKVMAIKCKLFEARNLQA
jgi:hypothetical protein